MERSPKTNPGFTTLAHGRFMAKQKRNPSFSLTKLEPKETEEWSTRRAMVCIEDVSICLYIYALFPCLVQPGVAGSNLLSRHLSGKRNSWNFGWCIWLAMAMAGCDHPRCNKKYPDCGFVHVPYFELMKGNERKWKENERKWKEIRGEVSLPSHFRYLPSQSRPFPVSLPSLFPSFSALFPENETGVRRKMTGVRREWGGSETEDNESDGDKKHVALIGVHQIHGILQYKYLNNIYAFMWLTCYDVFSHVFTQRKSKKMCLSWCFRASRLSRYVQNGNSRFEDNGTNGKPKNTRKNMFFVQKFSKHVFFFLFFLLKNGNFPIENITEPTGPSQAPPHAPKTILAFILTSLVSRYTHTQYHTHQYSFRETTKPPVFSSKIQALNRWIGYLVQHLLQGPFTAFELLLQQGHLKQQWPGCFYFFKGWLRGCITNNPCHGWLNKNTYLMATWDSYGVVSFLFQLFFRCTKHHSPHLLFGRGSQLGGLEFQLSAERRHLGVLLLAQNLHLGQRGNPNRSRIPSGKVPVFC